MDRPIKISAKTKYVGCLVTPEEKDKLNKIAKHYDVSLAELIRFALNQLEKKHDETQD